MQCGETFGQMDRLLSFKLPLPETGIFVLMPAKRSRLTRKVIGPFFRHYDMEAASMSITKNYGMLLLAIWLILHGLLILVPSLAFQRSDVILAILAIASGVLILIGR